MNQESLCSITSFDSAYFNKFHNYKLSKFFVLLLLDNVENMIFLVTVGS